MIERKCCDAATNKNVLWTLKRTKSATWTYIHSSQLYERWWSVVYRAQYRAQYTRCQKNTEITIFFPIFRSPLLLLLAVDVDVAFRYCCSCSILGVFSLQLDDVLFFLSSQLNNFKDLNFHFIENVSIQCSVMFSMNEFLPPVHKNFSIFFFIFGNWKWNFSP